MGSTRWNEASYARYSADTSSKSREEIFTSRNLDPDLDPAKIKVRESVDSEANPQSTPIILGSDVTGSMGMLAEEIVKRGLGVVMKAIYKHKPITDPHIMGMAIGDTTIDRAPLQVTQFEAGVEPLTAQMEKMWIEGGGGGNAGESYPFAWWFALTKTTCDAIIKRHRKGYLFTIGDEQPLPVISKADIARFGGVGSQADVDSKELLKETQRFWNVFHLIVKPVASQPVVKTWETWLGDHAIMVQDPSKITEVIVALIRLTEGQTDITDDLDKGTALIVKKAVAALAHA